MTTLRLPNEHYLRNDNWIDLVASHLLRGSLAVVIGAGASAGMGLPTWSELVKRCLILKKIKFDPSTLGPQSSAVQLGLYMDQVEDACSDKHEYNRIVSSALYRGVRLNDTAIQAPLLIALGALLMGSRRGSVSEVITFNFDVVLEYYLALHGYTVQSYDDLPVLHSADDVRIGHINGRLGTSVLKFPEPKRLVLSQISQDDRSGADFDAWTFRLKNLMLSHLVLFVGVSGEDPVLFPVLQNVAGQLKSSRPTGVWLFGYDIDAKGDERRRRDFLARNVIPICLDDYDKLPPNILRVCQKAAKHLVK